MDVKEHLITILHLATRFLRGFMICNLFPEGWPLLNMLFIKHLHFPCPTYPA